MCWSSGGENALKVLPHLVDFIPEAKLNLVRIVHVGVALRHLQCASGHLGPPPGQRCAGLSCGCSFPRQSDPRPHRPPSPLSSQVIYHLRHDSVSEAYELIKDLDPSIPQEYILKGVVNTMMGQNLGSREHLKMAQQFFQLVRAPA